MSFPIEILARDVASRAGLSIEYVTEKLAPYYAEYPDYKFRLGLAHYYIKGFEVMVNQNNRQVVVTVQKQGVA